MYGVIYRVTNTKTGENYIGQTVKSVHKRWLEHIRHSKNFKDRNVAYQKLPTAIRQYGENAFEIIQIDTAETKEELDQKEIYWIDYYDSVNNGYNTRIGGNQGRVLEETAIKEVSQKIRKTKIGEDNPMARAIKCKNIKTGEELYFDTLVEGARHFGEDKDSDAHSFVMSRLNGSVKRPFKNEWIFAYKDSDYPPYILKGTVRISKYVTIKVTNLITFETAMFKDLTSFSEATGISKQSFSSQKYRHGNNFTLQNYSISVLV